MCIRDRGDASRHGPRVEVRVKGVEGDVGHRFRDTVVVQRSQDQRSEGPLVDEVDFEVATIGRPDSEAGVQMLGPGGLRMGQ